MPFSREKQVSRRTGTTFRVDESDASHIYYNRILEIQLKLKLQDISDKYFDNKQLDFSTGNGNGHHPDLFNEKLTKEIVPDAKTQENNEYSRSHYKIFGWRKKCLYGIIIILVLMVTLNLGLTLWMIKIMDFSLEGMGQLKIIPGGLRLEGKIFFIDNLITNSILSRLGFPLSIESSTSVTLRSRLSDGQVRGYLHLENSKVECQSENFRIMSENKVLFSANSNDVFIASDILKIKGEGGTKFKGSIQTTVVRGESGQDLKLESPTRRLTISAPTGISLESKGGSVHTLALNDITFDTEGSVNLQASSIFMPFLATARVSQNLLNEKDKHFDVFQVCVCGSGKIFLADPQAICSLENLDLCG